MTKSLEDYTLEEAGQKIEQVLNENPKPIEGLNAIYQYDITDENQSFQLHLADGKAKVEFGAPQKADCILQISFADFKKLLLGELSGTVAFMTGKLKIKGDIGKAIKMENVLRQYNVKQYL
ncbi:SCP2 sterol-binding domain-containing protein [Caenibacillus caldisaponilyticus]|uniref:SCP2 sterol-binding domain-containing protein n=1 Tax=Caenibacillus caldisaponilyticus TaxID=1674942 RepID=UPI0009885A89|nr:SCP2 sterol-binding domain-containing protein [Caenibacillus caldisaponilyticus]